MVSFQKRGKTWKYTINNKGTLIGNGGFKTIKAAQVVAPEVETNLRKRVIVTMLEWLEIRQAISQPPSTLSITIEPISIGGFPPRCISMPL